MDTLFHLESTQAKQKSNEWYTPAKYIDAARQVMGGIDLDPASSELANQTVKAGKIYTVEDDGLKQPWNGRIWLNPPYSSQGMVGRSGNAAGPMQYFIAKLMYHYQSGDVSQAVVVVTTDTDASWFQSFWEFPICFATHRVMFNRPDGTREKQFFGTSFIYLGPNESKFIEVFSQFGRIAKAIDTPPAKPRTRTLWEESA